MPWKIEDVDRFKGGLSPKEKEKWVQVANASLESCLAKGGTEKDCAAAAVKIANSQTEKMMQVLIELTDSGIEHVLLYPGKFEHGLYGKFEVTEELIDHAIENFNNGIGTRFSEDGKPELPANYQHAGHAPDPEQAKASGWIKGLVKKAGKLFMQIEWTAKAIEYIKNKEYRFISPEFTENYKDEEGKAHGFTVLGVALTNYNFLKKNQLAIALSEESIRVIHDPDSGLEDGGETRKENQMEELLKLFECGEEELIGKVKELKEQHDALTAEKADFETKLTEASEGLQAKEQELIEANEKLADVEKKLIDSGEGVKLSDEEYKELKEGVAQGINAEKRLARMEADAAIEKELSSEKPRFLPKQKEFFVKMYLRDVDEYNAFLENAEPVIEMGASGSGNDYTGNPEKDFVGLIEEIIERDKVDYREAVKRAQAENPELVKMYMGKE